MKLYNSILTASLIGCAFLTGCRDEFSELNQSKDSVTVAEPSFLMSQAIIDFEVSGYTYWYYNAPMYYRWSQMGVPTGGFTAQYTELSATGDQGTQYISPLRYRNELNNIIQKAGEDGNKYKSYAAICNVLTVYAAIFDSDISGDRPYTEAAMAKFGGTLTPKYDRMAELYPIWLNELDECIEVFQRKDQEIIGKGSQDPIYKGDLTKWAKLANSLKLKIATRLLVKDKAKALALAESVANASCGYIDSESDDMIFVKATTITNDDGDKVYHWNNGVLGGIAGNKAVLDFMLQNKDPRVRFCYTKNDFNSKVVQGFIDAGKYNDLPSYVKENVILDEKGNFKAWGGYGEPWVRYAGLPAVYEKANDPNYAEYFNPGTRFNLSVDNATKSYSHYSLFQEEMLRGRKDFTLPTLPGAAVIEDLDDMPWYGMYITSAEINLYLAEFKLLGANLPKSAESYYTSGVEASVKAYNKVAGLNNIPYYSKTYDYDPNEKIIALQNGEIEELLSNEAIALTGTTAEKLEKVYIQQLLHFTLFPNDQFVTAKRSGCPTKNSTLIPFVEFTGYVSVTGIPRRFEFGSPSPTDQMYDILLESYKNQGFTLGSSQSGGAYNVSGTVLNTERLWQDEGAPQWGAGPSL